LVRLGSPIESDLLIALVVRGVVGGLPDSWIKDSYQQFPDAYPVGSFYGMGSRVLLVQCPVGSYRADLAIVDLDRVSAPIAIEADGHDFHERTKEQARHDRQRDRWFSSSGWRVLRFTGSEIYRDAAAVAEEVVQFVSQEDLREAGASGAQRRTAVEAGR
jgi:very-short-patch-repair endonuclease